VFETCLLEMHILRKSKGQEAGICPKKETQGGEYGEIPETIPDNFKLLDLYCAILFFVWSFPSLLPRLFGMCRTLVYERLVGEHERARK